MNDFQFANILEKIGKWNITPKKAQKIAPLDYEVGNLIAAYKYFPRLGTKIIKFFSKYENYIKSLAGDDNNKLQGLFEQERLIIKKLMPETKRNKTERANFVDKVLGLLEYIQKQKGIIQVNDIELFRTCTSPTEENLILFCIIRNKRNLIPNIRKYLKDNVLDETECETLKKLMEFDEENAKYFLRGRKKDNLPLLDRLLDYIKTKQEEIDKTGYKNDINCFLKWLIDKAFFQPHTDNIPLVFELIKKIVDTLINKILNNKEQLKITFKNGNYTINWKFMLEYVRIILLLFEEKKFHFFDHIKFLCEFEPIASDLAWYLEMYVTNCNWGDTDKGIYYINLLKCYFSIEEVMGKTKEERRNDINKYFFKGSNRSFKESKHGPNIMNMLIQINRDEIGMRFSLEDLMKMTIDIIEGLHYTLDLYSTHVDDIKELIIKIYESTEREDLNTNYAILYLSTIITACLNALSKNQFLYGTSSYDKTAVYEKIRTFVEIINNNRNISLEILASIANIIMAASNNAVNKIKAIAFNFDIFKEEEFIELLDIVSNSRKLPEDKKKFQYIKEEYIGCLIPYVKGKQYCKNSVPICKGSINLDYLSKLPDEIFLAYSDTLSQEEKSQISIYGMSIDVMLALPIDGIPIKESPSGKRRLRLPEAKKIQGQ